MSDFELRRLRSGEVIAGLSGVLLLVFMFAPSWYALNGTLAPTATLLGARTSWDGWWALGGWRYLVLLAILAALALAYFQAAERAPAIPVSLAVIVAVLGGLSVVVVLYRLLAGAPIDGSLLHQQAGGWLALLATIGTAYGGYASMRQEQGATIGPGELETVRIEPPTGT